MIKYCQNLSILLAAVILLSCKDDPFPLPAADFFTDPGIVEVGVPVMFDNLTTNAASYEWDFGDGQTSTEISPTITYSESGNFTVVLTSITQDGQSLEFEKNVDVKERVFTGYRINLFPLTNGEEPWDVEPTYMDDSTFADLLVFLAPTDDSNPDFYQDGIFLDLDGTPAGGAGNDMVFTDEDWDFILFDYDGDTLGDIQGSDFIAMTGVTFNPIQYPDVIKFEGGDSGYIALFFTDQTTGDIIDVDLFFDLE